MSRSLFVSDIHIQSPDDERAELFRRFVVWAQKNPPEHLFLNGDIFDLWVADREYFVNAYLPLIEELLVLQKRGCKIHYFEGNHDLDLKLYWQNRLGFDVQVEAAFYEIDGQTVRVEHGDQMDPDDHGYLFLRALLRTPPIRWLGRMLPNRSVAWIGRRASHASRDYTTHVKSASEETSRAKIRAHALKVYEQRPFDLIVSGHLHVSEDSRPGDKFRCINTGTWLKKPLVFELKDGKGRLVGVEELMREL